MLHRHFLLQVLRAQVLHRHVLKLQVLRVQLQLAMHRLQTSDAPEARPLAGRRG